MWLVVGLGALGSAVVLGLVLAVVVWEDPWPLIAVIAIPMWVWPTHRQIEAELAAKVRTRESGL